MIEIHPLLPPHPKKRTYSSEQSCCNKNYCFCRLPSCFYLPCTSLESHVESPPPHLPQTHLPLCFPIVWFVFVTKPTRVFLPSRRCDCFLLLLLLKRLRRAATPQAWQHGKPQRRRSRLSQNSRCHACPLALFKHSTFSAGRSSGAS